jgi:hypothetical protein
MIAGTPTAYIKPYAGIGAEDRVYSTPRYAWANTYLIRMIGEESCTRISGFQPIPRERSLPPRTERVPGRAGVVSVQRGGHGREHVAIDARWRGAYSYVLKWKARSPWYLIENLCCSELACIGIHRSEVSQARRSVVDAPRIPAEIDRDRGKKEG